MNTEIICINPQIIKFNKQLFFGFNESINLPEDEFIMFHHMKKNTEYKNDVLFIELKNKNFIMLYPQNYKYNNFNINIRYDDNSITIYSIEILENNNKVFHIHRIKYYNKKYIYSSENIKNILFDNKEYFILFYKYFIWLYESKNNYIDEIFFHYKLSELTNEININKIIHIFKENTELIFEYYNKNSNFDKIINENFYTLINTYKNFSKYDICDICKNDKKQNLLLLNCMNLHYVCINCFSKISNKCPYCRHKLSDDYKYNSE